MSNYLDAIKVAILVFPLVAFLISLPFILSQYHKYGSISFLKAVIIYSFVFYMMCAYFLVILPLPERSAVAAMTTPRTQLIPFKFVGDFITQSKFNITNVQTYLPALAGPYVYVPIFNILLTLPFGIYLRYLFKLDMKHIVIASFLLSLFFELTQLTGLYFIYPRGYRLFDVDDLMLNTLGGLLGYLVAAPLVKIIPSTEKLNAETREKGKVVSGFRRTLALFLDIFLCLCLSMIISIMLPDMLQQYNLMLAIIIYFFGIPLVLRDSTVMEKFLRLRIVDDRQKENHARASLRRLLFMGFYFGLPWLGLELVTIMPGDRTIQELVILGLCGVCLIFYAVTAIRFLFTNKPMLYERLSHTRVVSTIAQ